MTEAMMDSRSNEVPKHTPGPWSYAINGEERIAGYPPIAIYKADKTEFISQAQDGYYDYVAVSEADARLIAAAPEMLEALKQIAKWHDYEQSTHELAMRMYWSSRLAYDIIAKAEGGQL